MNKQKQDIYEWICYMVLGTSSLFVSYSIAITIATLPLPTYVQIPFCIIASFLIIRLYIFFEKMYESISLSWRTLYYNIKSFLLGWGLIFGLFCLSIAILHLLGCYEVSMIQFHLDSLLESFFLFMLVAISEELLFRGIIYRLIRDRWNYGIALIISSLIFGFVHQLNDNATFWSSASIAITSGFLLGTTYEYYNAIWVPIGMHWAWNFTEGSIFGCPVSGYNELVPIIKPIIQGNKYLTGGEFGPEASVIVVTMGTFLSILFLYLIVRKRKNTQIVSQLFEGQ